VAVTADDKPVAQVTTDDEGQFSTRVEAEVLGVGPHSLQASVETAAGWLRPSRSEPAHIDVAAPQPVPIAYTLAAFAATAGAAAAFLAMRSRPWARWMGTAAGTGPEGARPAAAEPTAGLALARPGLVSTLRRPADHGFAGVVRDAVRHRPLAGAHVRLMLGGRTLATLSDPAGEFAVEGLDAGEWRGEAAFPGHVTERFTLSIPHRGELRGVRLDLMPVRERVFAMYRRVAEPLLPNPELWGIWSPRQIVDHVRRARPTGALAILTDFVEEAFFSARTPDEAVLPEAGLRIEAALRELA
jgi:hypothetical protein